MDFVTYLQGEGRHSINVLLAIYALTQEARKQGKPDTVDWKEVQKWIRSNFNTSIADSTYRNRRAELEEMGLIELTPIDKLRSTLRLTPKGEKYAIMLKDFLEEIKQLSEEQK